jgi:hypothetical protein
MGNTFVGSGNGFDGDEQTRGIGFEYDFQKLCNNIGLVRDINTDSQQVSTNMGVCFGGFWYIFFKFLSLLFI